MNIAIAISSTALPCTHLLGVLSGYQESVPKANSLSARTPILGTSDKEILVLRIAVPHFQLSGPNYRLGSFDRRFGGWDQKDTDFLRRSVYGDDLGNVEKDLNERYADWKSLRYHSNNNPLVSILLYLLGKAKDGMWRLLRV